MGTVVIQDEMDIHPRRGAAIDAPEKAQKLLMAMARHTVSQNLAVQHIQGREQGRGAMANVVVGLPFWKSRTQGQDCLGTIQGLDLAFLIHAQHQGFLGRIQVQTNDVAQFVKKLRIGSAEARHRV